MKYVKMFLICGMLCSLYACGNPKTEQAPDGSAELSVSGEQEETDADTDKKEIDQTEKISEADEKNQEESFVRKVMLNDKIYVDTGETSHIGRCGVMDFKFDSSVEQGDPLENNQTNFGIGYGGQIGNRENRIEICIDEEWHVFAYHENDLPGVTMEVTESTDHSIKLEIKNETDLDIRYGEDYQLEKLDEEINTWITCYPDSEMAFHDVAYSVEKGGTGVWTVDWTDDYGELEAGKYRIIKKMVDFRDTKDYTTYTLTTEFTV